MALYEMSAGTTLVSTNASMVASLVARTLVLQAHPSNTVNIQVSTSSVQSIHLSGLTVLTLPVSHAHDVYAKTSAGSATLLWIAYRESSEMPDAKHPARSIEPMYRRLAELQDPEDGLRWIAAYLDLSQAQSQAELVEAVAPLPPELQAPVITWLTRRPKARGRIQ